MSFRESEPVKPYNAFIVPVYSYVPKAISYDDAELRKWS